MADRGSTTETLSPALYAQRTPSNTVGYYDYPASLVTTFYGAIVPSGGGDCTPIVKVWSAANNRWEVAPSA